MLPKSCWDFPLSSELKPISFNDVFQILLLRWFWETEAFGTATHFRQSFCLRLSSAYNAFGKRGPEQDCGGAVILQASGSVDRPMCSKPKQMFYKSAVASAFFCAGNNTIYKLITNANWITRLVLFFTGSNVSLENSDLEAPSAANLFHHCDLWSPTVDCVYNAVSIYMLTHVFLRGTMIFNKDIFFPIHVATWLYHIMHSHC